MNYSNFAKTIASLLFVCLLQSSFATAEDSRQRQFQRIQLSNKFYCEGAYAADLNNDGKMDVISGPYWYAGPKFTQRHAYREVKAFDIKDYSGNFLTFAGDFNGDQWIDILVVGYPGKEAFWFENPADTKSKKDWKKHLAFSVVDNESPNFRNVTGNKRPELICMTGGKITVATSPSSRSKGSGKGWSFRSISSNNGYPRFTHGLGVGDINSDGRQDILEKSGWWEQPNDLEKTPVWKFHKFQFTDFGGSHMHAYDFDNDGDNDVITSTHAHGYGLSWFENIKNDKNEITFKEHKIMGKLPEENNHGVAFSQLHSIALADMNSDGVMDIVTGKRYFAHGGHDPGGMDPAVLYWFETKRMKNRVDFIPHLIDMNSGVGTQVEAMDLNGDGKPDVVIGNKKGTFVFLNQIEKSKKE